MGLLDSVGVAVKKVFGKGVAEDARRRRAAGALSASDFPVPSVADLLAAERHRIGNSLHIVSLRRFEERIGDAAWNQHADKIVHHARDILATNPTGRGSAGWPAPNTLILTFPGLDEATGRCAARTVAIQLVKKLTGERVCQGDEVTVDLMAIETDTVIGPSGTLDPERLRAAIGGAAARALRRDRAAAGDWAPIDWPPQGLAPGRNLVVPKLDPETALGADVALAYSPIRAVERDRIERYRLAAVDATTSAPLAAPSRGGGRRPTLDLAALFYALEDLEDRIERNDPELLLPTLVVPISHSTVQADSRIALGSVLRYFPDAVRSRHLCLEVVGIDARASLPRLRDTADFLGNLCREVMWRVDPEAKSQVKALAGLGGWIGADAAEWGAGTPEKSATLIANLSKAVRPARSFCWSLADKRLEAVARNQHCALIEGPIIGPATPAPPLAAPRLKCPGA